MANPLFRTVSVLAFSLLSLPLSAQIHVDAASQPGGNGQSWTTAYDDLQQALSSAASGQSVWVASGTYAGGFTIPDGVAVLGGFATGERRADQARPLDNPTVLDGQGTQRVVELGSGSAIDGFVLQNGNAPAPGGGGALVDGGTATIRRCVFTANQNSGGRGAALSIVNGADPLVADCVFHHNDSSGHTIDVRLGSSGTYDHITVVDNPHNGLHMQEGAACTIQNSIFARNQGRGICDVLVGAPNQPTVNSNLFWQNTSGLFHIQGTDLHTAAAVNALSYATGNIAADPVFQGGLDYRLQSNSGAIDLALPGVDTRRDLGGMPRTTDGDLDGNMRSDFGAHEFNNCVLTSTGNATPGGTLVLQVDASSAFGGVAALFPGPSTTVAPFGTVYGTSPIVAILGFLPGSLSVNIPPGLITDIVFQGFCFSPTSTGNLSNPLGFAIR